MHNHRPVSLTGTVPRRRPAWINTHLRPCPVGTSSLGSILASHVRFNCKNHLFRLQTYMALSQNPVRPILDLPVRRHVDRGRRGGRTFDIRSLSSSRHLCQDAGDLVSSPLPPPSLLRHHRPPLFVFPSLMLHFSYNGQPTTPSLSSAETRCRAVVGTRTPSRGEKGSMQLARDNNTVKTPARTRGGHNQPLRPHDNQVRSGSNAILHLPCSIGGGLQCFHDPPPPPARLHGYLAPYCTSHSPRPPTRLSVTGRSSRPP